MQDAMNILKRLFNLSITIVIFLGCGSALKAQSGHYSASSLSMGGTGTAYLDTYHANFVNPANLILNNGDKPSMSLGLLGGLSATAGGPLLNISAYNKHFTTGEVVNAERALDDWFGTRATNSRRMGLELDIIPIAGAWRGENIGFSLALRNRTFFSGSVNRGYAEVALSGVTQERFGDPKPVDFSTKAVAFSEVSAGFSYKILELPSLAFAENIKIYGGIAPKYIIPHYTSSIDFNSTLQVADRKVVHDFEYTFQTVGELTSQFRQYHDDSQDENFDGSLNDYVEPNAGNFSAVQGSGFGVDLGGTIEMDLAGPMAQVFSWIGGPKSLRVGLSVTDIGSISYDKNAGSFTANDTFTWDGVDLDDGFDDALSDSIRKEIYLNYEPGTEDKIVEKLPTKINLGGHLQLGKLAFALDFSKGVNEQGMNSPRVALGLGAEYKLFNIIPFRAGYRTGGLTSSSITFGTGLELRNFEFTVGGLTVPNSENRGSGIGGAWSGLVLRF
jgi:hypothetical protein